ncbi:EAL domain-containing protein [Marinobacter sp. SS21]|uniref:EAL domain-containing protein n=1 Tax=Marinobacter sp. SS21 TaxID=2979460 RepID=UPI00232AA684|nr:EAL domain-containing protein [Marinobacter sp. SS21]MDC0662227.1 EAL domain-containing protein [Marinobacter sp. SS21]
METSHSHSQPALPALAQPLSLTPAWVPLLLVLLAVGYGLLMHAFYHPQPLLAHPGGFESDQPPRPRLHYVLDSLDRVLASGHWRQHNWQAAPNNGSGIGYLTGPATFRFQLDNPGDQPRQRLIVVAAPFLDHIAPAAIRDGVVDRLPVMGDLYPFNTRLYKLPQWVWPVTLPPRSSTVYLFEVRNTGPTMLPVTLQSPQEVVDSSALTLVWKAFVAGLLGFAMVFNILMVGMLRRPELAWLSVLLLGVILTQLVIEGFGPWLLWPNLPAANALIGISLPMCLIAICQFTRHAIELPQLPSRILNGLSLIAFLLLVTTPLQIPYLGQGSLLVLATVALFYILVLVLQRLRSHLYARYFAAAVLALLLGALVSSIRTIGWVPVNSLTNSAFFLGTSAAALILTMGIGQQLLEERRRRQLASLRVREERSRRVRLKADYDRLLITHRVTGRPNRVVVEETLDQLHRQGEPYTLLLIRIERFHEIEQSLGHQASEHLLNAYLGQLDSFLRKLLGNALVRFNRQPLGTVDTVNHTFAVYRNHLEKPTDQLWPALTQWLEAGFVEDRYAFSWAPSIGIAHSQQHGNSGAEVLSCAGSASLNRTQTLTEYDSAVAEQQYQKQMLMLDLDGALNNDDIYLLYQPKVSLADHRVVAFEALIRWQHPEFGAIAPDQWIPLAEQLGTIHRVTRWILDRVCRDWHQLAPHYGNDLTLAINISALDLTQPAFDQTALATLQRHGIAPQQLILEITETSMMANTALAQGMIHRLSQAGFQIALDDFGTGHSSLGTLASFDLDELKIDRSFLQDITTDLTRQRILRTALELGEALQLRIVVEGVENGDVAAWLQQFPGLYGQGYYWSRPVSVRQLSERNP